MTRRKFQRPRPLAQQVSQEARARWEGTRETTFLKSTPALHSATIQTSGNTMQNFIAAVFQLLAPYAMQVTRSLLALIQFFSLCQIAFGLFGVSVHFQSGKSSIPRQIDDDRVREVVVNWHQDTITTSRRWCIVSGILFFVLSTGVLVLLQSPPDAGERNNQRSRR